MSSPCYDFAEMAATTVIQERLASAFALYDELVAELPEASLASTLPGLRSNAIGDQLWCVVGARESYARAIEAGEWSGFGCSLSATGSREREAVARALSASGAVALRAVAELDPAHEARCRLSLQLLEHEAAHHGQLIRYLYGLKLPVPAGWRSRYALD